MKIINDIKTLLEGTDYFADTIVQDYNDEFAEGGEFTPVFPSIYVECVNLTPDNSSVKSAASFTYNVNIYLAVNQNSLVGDELVDTMRDKLNSINFDENFRLLYECHFVKAVMIARMNRKIVWQYILNIDSRGKY